ncbi:3-oxoacyl-[acyl-carrier protein] reductase [Actinomycetospora succinea]|uniref:3-oxoacyl-[acyl-carrier protein] reductase n=1 Tax=Actinomycetospora succinea TaxID=663603 RepID=A0A4R6UVR0_9PSEU|nr:3-oxoacyl-[acyl-carrier protein] reductase [Actinomycetospora succinea]
MTGGSRGIGAAVARRLARDGAAVALTFVEHERAAADVVAAIGADGGTARAFRLDVADPAGFGPVVGAAQAFYAEAGARGLGVLVADAGIAAHQPLAAVDVATWDRVMPVNARGVLLAVQHAAARMVDGGRIVAVSTVGTAWPSPGETVYAASKAAVEQIVRVASRELGGRGITVNTVSAGPTDTDLLRAGAPPEALAGAAALTALGRIGEPRDVADVVGLLCRPEAGWLTGANLRADGGLT